MTNEQLKEILSQLHLEFDTVPSLIYVFYQTDDGLVNNFSISLRRARNKDRRPMDANRLAELMQCQYPATREARLLAVEHPKEGLTQWIDSSDVCQRLHTTPRTLQRWRRQGLLHPARMGRRIFYDEAEVDALLRSNIIQDNHRLDKSGS